jgi:hypothetical protein
VLEDAEKISDIDIADAVANEAAEVVSSHVKLDQKEKDNILIQILDKVGEFYSDRQDNDNQNIKDAAQAVFESSTNLSATNPSENIMSLLEGNVFDAWISQLEEGYFNEGDASKWLNDFLEFGSNISEGVEVGI